jgi:integrase
LLRIETDEKTKSTYNRNLQQIGEVFKTLRVKAGLTDNVWKDVTRKKHVSKGKRPLTEEEFSGVSETATGKLRYWLALGFYTGMRLKDCVTLRWSEVHFSKHLIERKAAKLEGDTDEALNIPIFPVLETMLKQLYKERPKGAVFLFPHEAEKYKSRRRWVGETIQRHFLECGIDTHAEGTGKRIVRDDDGNPIRDEKGKVKLKDTGKDATVRVGFHSLRHTFVSLLAKKGIQQAAIMELVGHSSPSMTAHYTHADDEQKQAAIAALPAAVFDGKKAKSKAKTKTAKRRAKVKA